MACKAEVERKPGEVVALRQERRGTPQPQLQAVTIERHVLGRPERLRKMAGRDTDAARNRSDADARLRLVRKTAASRTGPTVNER